PLARLVKAGDAVEHRRLAGAVGPDQRGDVAAPRAETEIVAGDEPAEAHAEVLDRNHRHGARGRGRRVRGSAGRRRRMTCRAHRWCSRTSEGCVVCAFSACKRAERGAFSSVEGSRVAIKPRGLQTMISTIPKPNSSMRYWVGSKSLPNTALRKS